MHAYVATKNAGKLRELRAIFADSGWELRSFEGYVEPAEGATSYADNAALKARTLSEQLLAAGIDAPALGDDSGIEVAALGDAPGVLSARYGGEASSWSERRQMLLREAASKGDPASDARFVCVLHFHAGDGLDYSGRGEVEGRLAPRERGDGGFSYDAIFEYPPLAKTFAELSEVEKNAISHRRRAARALLDALASSV